MFTVDELFSKRNQRLAFEHLALKKEEKYKPYKYY